MQSNGLYEGRKPLEIEGLKNKKKTNKLCSIILYLRLNLIRTVAPRPGPRKCFFFFDVEEVLILNLFSLEQFI